MSISASLQKAIKLQEKIDRMREQLAELLSKARQEIAGSKPAVEVKPKPRRRIKLGAARPSKTRKRVAGAATPQLAEVPVAEKAATPRGKNAAKGPRKGKTRGKGRSRRSLAGQKRASSPSGPLAPAVVKVIEAYGEPMRVADILDGLLKDGYAFNSSEPKKNLAARIYRLSGVRQVEPGLFTTA